MQLIALLFLFISSECLAQNELEGKFRFSTGYGVAVLEITQDDLEGFRTTGPFYFKFAYGLYHNLSLGLNGAFARYHNERHWIDPYTYQNISESYYYDALSILLRMNYHFNEIDNKRKFDPYAGIGIGYRQLESDLYNFHSLETRKSLGFDSTVGLNFFLSNVIATYAEFGIAKSGLQFGFTASF